MSSPGSVDLDPAFKMVLIIVVVVMAATLIVMAILAGTDAKNADSHSLFGLCSDTFKIGFGALVGLLGGKKL